MKPIVSAAAAAFLLVGGRRGGATPSPRRDDDDDEPVSNKKRAEAATPLEHRFAHATSASDLASSSSVSSFTDADSDSRVFPSDSSDCDSDSYTATDYATAAAHRRASSAKQRRERAPNSRGSSEPSARTNPNFLPYPFRAPLDWDWSDSPDDSSIWTATAAVLGGALGRLPATSESGGVQPADGPPGRAAGRAVGDAADDNVHVDDHDHDHVDGGVGVVDDDDAGDAVAPLRDAMETLSAALRGLRALPSSADDDPASCSLDTDDAAYDVRPLIAVTIGVALFLISRSPRTARRTELEAGAADTALVVDDDVFLEETDADYSVLSDLRTAPRDIVIVTTAALPWMTGTAVNPLLRAVYLAAAGHTVSLVVPWLENPEDQQKVYSSGTLFSSRDEQTAVIMRWARDQVPGVDIRVRYYDGVYSKEFGSILPLGDITALFVDDDVCDVCVLEEPEHLTWFHTGRRWTSLFKFCVGVVHTNYIEYAKKHGVFGPQRALFLNFLNKWVCRSYCHRVIKLSDAVQSLPHSVTCNVHGVRDRFIDIGRSRGDTPFEMGAYFLGKVLWAKGYQQLVELMEEHFERNEQRLPIDFFGAGPDLEAVKARVNGSYALSRVQIHGLVVDHASDYLQRYKVYVNPSKSDVVCTATAEALAMGKFIVCLKHPSNEFFATFDNCLIYSTMEEFSAQLAYALMNDPKPLSFEDAYRLSWEAATERFYDASYIPSPLGNRGVNSALALTHKTICATLVTPPANSAVRDRYRTERRGIKLERAKSRRDAKSRVSVM